MESLVIRPFTPSDQDRVTEIFTDWNRHIAAPDTANAFETYIRRSITEEMGRIPEYYQAHPKSGFWVAETNGDVVGMVGIEHLSDDEAEVRRMYVDAGLRRRGIGPQLLTHAEAFCARAGYAAHRPQHLGPASRPPRPFTRPRAIAWCAKWWRTSRPTAPSAVASGAITM